MKSNTHFEKIRKEFHKNKITIEKILNFNMFGISNWRDNEFVDIILNNDSLIAEEDKELLKENKRNEDVVLDIFRRNNIKGIGVVFDSKPKSSGFAYGETIEEALVQVLKETGVDVEPKTEDFFDKISRKEDYELTEEQVHDLLSKEVVFEVITKGDYCLIDYELSDNISYIVNKHPDFKKGAFECGWTYDSLADFSMYIEGKELFGFLAEVTIPLLRAEYDYKKEEFNGEYMILEKEIMYVYSETMQGMYEQITNKIKEKTDFTF